MKKDERVWFRSLHYGGKHTCLWWVIQENGQLHVRAELVKPKCLISTLAQEIRRKTRELEIPSIHYTVALRVQMIGTTTKEDDGETVADTFRSNGLVIRETSHDPIQGWTRIAELLGQRPDGRPWLTIDPSCEALQRALTNAVSDPTDTESILDPAEPLRALRVGAMSRPAPRPLQPLPMPKNAVGHLLEEARGGGRSKNLLAWH